MVPLVSPDPPTLAALSAAFESAPVGLAVLDRDLRYLHVNGLLARMNGVAQAAHAGRTVREVVGDEVAFVEPLLRRVIETGRPLADLELQRADPATGEVLDWVLSFTPLVVGGDVAGVVATALDVTERNRAEAALRASEARLQLAQRAGRVGAFEWLIEEGRVVWSPALEALYGAAEGTFEGTFEDWARRVVPEDARRVEAEIGEVIAARRVDYAYEFRAVRPDGPPRWLAGQAQFFYDDAGRPRRMIGVNVDIDDRKRTEDALRESEARFRLMADAVPQILWITDAEGHAEFFNRQWTAYTGRPYERTTAADVATAAVHPDDAAVTMARFEEARRTGHTYLVEHRIRSAAGDYRWFLVRGEPYRDPSTGEVTRWFGASVDIHDRRLAEEALRRSEDQQAFLLRLADRLRPVADPVEAEYEAARTLGEHLGANRVAYFEVTGPDYVVECDYVDGSASLAGGYPVASFGPKLLEGLRAGRAVVLPDIAADPDISAPERAAYDAVQIGALVSVPLVKGGRLVAGLTVHQAAPRAWTEGEVALVEETAERTWAAVERARAEDALRHSEERLQQALDAAGMGAFAWDPEEDRTDADARMLALFGLPEGASLTLADALASMIHPDDTARYTSAVARALDPAGPGVLREDIRVVHADGTERSLTIVGQVHFAGGRPVRMAGTARDVTEERQAEASLHASEERYRALFDSIDEGFCVIDVLFDPDGRPFDYRFVEVNPAFGAQTGLPDAVGRTMRDFAPAMEQHWFDIYGRVATTGEPVRFENEAQELGRHYDVYAFRVGEPEQRRVAVLFNDVTPRKQVETALRTMNEALEAGVAERTRELEVRNRELQDFAHVASHDLQEPLRKIQTYAGLLVEEHGPTLAPEALAYADRMASASGRMGRLITDLLTLSRVTTRGLATVPVHLDAALDGALGDLEARLDETGGRVERAGPLGVVRADPVQLHQLLLNLVGNGLKFHKPGEAPVVRVSARAEGRGVVVTVEDNGVGFDPKYAERIFGPFQRLHSRDAYAGTGIGLAIVRRIAERHGGAVTAESTPGEGSRFSITFPSG